MSGMGKMGVPLSFAPTTPQSFYDNAGPIPSTPGNPIIVQTYISPSLRKIFIIDVSAAVTGIFYWKINNVEMGRRATSPSNISAVLNYPSGVPIDSGDVVEIFFEQRAGTPVVSITSYINGEVS